MLKMKKYFVTTYWFKSFFSKSLIWDIPNDDKIIYLTFDDGPTPEVTNKVLALLEKYKAKATFFCIGKNVENHPELYKQILKNGHGVGNHTQNHINGVKVMDAEYYDNISRASEHINSKLFRPPYGRIKNGQVKFLRDKYQIIMWSVLSGDFDIKLSKEQCKKNVIRNTKSGSIVVFHDSLKAKERMLYALEACLKYFQEKGYRFEAIKI